MCLSKNIENVCKCIQAHTYILYFNLIIWTNRLTEELLAILNLYNWYAILLQAELSQDPYMAEYQSHMDGLLSQDSTYQGDRSAFYQPSAQFSQPYWSHNDGDVFHKSRERFLMKISKWMIWLPIVKLSVNTQHTQVLDVEYRREIIPGWRFNVMTNL